MLQFIPLLAGIQDALVFGWNILGFNPLLGIV